MSGWKLTYLALLGASLYVAFGGDLPRNSVAHDVSYTIERAASSFGPEN